ncbi:MAG: flgN [Clostridia bacterium]|jgi:Asp-tRNA(Asn)/Glu-tRNA(Gln) amidotransferase C subunit|nr:flgN [Clostridia bacterium]
MKNQHICNLNQIIEKKLTFFKDMYDITVEQKKDIEENEADNIEALVQQKQQIIDKIDKLDEVFLAEYKLLKDELGIDSLELIDTDKHPEMKNVKEHIKSIMGMAHKIMELENSNKEKLDSIFQNVKNELRQIKTGRRSVKAYGSTPTYNDGVYIDRKK